MFKFFKKKDRPVHKPMPIEVLEFGEEVKPQEEPIKVKKNKKSYKPLKILITIIIFTTIFTIINYGNTSNIIVQSARRVLDSLGIYTEEITNVEIVSSSSDEAGSWKINKSARWLSSTEAEITIDISSVVEKSDKNKDIILLIDNSISMEGSRISALKTALTNFINNQMGTNDRVALVTYNDTAKILTTFTNNKDELIEKINSITPKNARSYTAALKSVNTIMNGYTKKKDTDVVVLMIANGLPSLNTNLEKSEYEIIKNKYSYLSIKGIQYEVNTGVMKELKAATDKQYKASEATISDVIGETALEPTLYEKFILTEYINNDNFVVKKLDDVTVSSGQAMILEEDGSQKIEWNLGVDKFATGRSNTMKVILSINDEISNVSGLYSLNSKTNIITKLPNREEKKMSPSKVLVLKNSYDITYDTNAPEGCKLDSIPKESHLVYKNVNKPSVELSCLGYLFKGFEVAENDGKDIVNVNDDVFKMPNHDITLRATWARQTITKSMDGTVYEKTTLYKLLENESLNGKVAKEYTGPRQDSIVESNGEKIYYFSAKDADARNDVQDKNNVIFADYCWQIIRTTATGGVKLIYNGEPDQYGRCVNGRSSHIGYENITELNLSGSFYYANSYSYDKNENKFILSEGITNSSWNSENASSLIGKYTCKSSNQDEKCSKLYYIESYKDNNTAKVLPIITNSDYQSIGKMVYNEKNNSLSYAGYMYNLVYPTSSKLLTARDVVLKSANISRDTWYSDIINFDSTYTMVNASLEEDNTKLVGKYTFGSSNKEYTSSTVRYITNVSGNKYYYIELSSGHDIDYYNYTYTYGDSFNKNEDGTYTINNSKSIKRVEWLENYDDIRGKYVCRSAGDTCSDLIYIVNRKNMIETTENNINNISYMYLKPSNNYKYAQGFVYENGVYKLNNESTTFFNIYDDKNLDSLNNYHYTCFNESGECENISYIYYYPIKEYKEDWQIDNTYLNYITLSNGKGIDEALYDMLEKDDVNKTNSVVKSAIDAWYEKNLASYDSYIADTVFCNDRRIKDLGGWNKTSGLLSSTLQFKGSDTTIDLSCKSETDQFSVSNGKAKLKYKVGLPTKSEVELMKSWSSDTSNYWSLSPIKFDTNMFMNASREASRVDSQNNIRPVISLIAGVEYVEGEGSMDYPYIVDLDK